MQKHIQKVSKFLWNNISKKWAVKTDSFGKVAPADKIVFQQYGQ